MTGKQLFDYLISKSLEVYKRKGNEVYVRSILDRKNKHSIEVNFDLLGNPL